MDGALELDHFPRQLVDPPGHLGVAAEQLVLDLIDVVFQAGHDRNVVIHDLVQQGVQHRLGTVPQEVRALLEAAAHLGDAAGLRMPDGDHEVLAGEDVQLAELHRLALVDVPRRPEHGEEVVAIALQLGALVRRNRVLDRQPMQAELGRDGGHFRFGWPVQPDPGHAAVLVEGLEGLLEAFRLGAADAVDVDGVIDDSHGPIIAAWPPGPGATPHGQAVRPVSAVTSTGPVPGCVLGTGG